MSDLLHAEWIKFRSLRGSWIRLAVVLAIDLAIVVFTLWFFNRSIGDVEPDTSIAARVGTITGGVQLAAILMVVVGVVVYTAEIKSRSIIPTLTAVPDRNELVGAKTLLVGLVGLATAIVVVILNTGTALVVLDLEDFPLSLDDTDVARAIVGSVVFLTLSALFGLGLGLIANSQTLGITLGVLWPTAIESSAKAFLPDWVERFMPFEAGSAMLAVPAKGDLPPWEGAAVFLLWAAALIVAGGAIFRKRDLGSS
jgi:hypothetical protein